MIFWEAWHIFRPLETKVIFTLFRMRYDSVEKEHHARFLISRFDEMSTHMLMSLPLGCCNWRFITFVKQGKGFFVFFVFRDGVSLNLLFWLFLKNQCDVWKPALRASSCPVLKMLNVHQQSGEIPSIIWQFSNMWKPPLPNPHCVLFCLIYLFPTTTLL